MTDSNFDSKPKQRTNARRPVEFVGRTKELEHILTSLESRTRAWIISLTGVGGIGKTELAIQCAHLALISELFDGVIWTTAKDSWLTPEGIRPFITDYALVSLNDLLSTIITVLEMDARLLSYSVERKMSFVKDKLSSAPYLIIVDNLETVQDKSIIQFLVDIPSPSKVLVTTRLGGLSALDVPIAQMLEGQREIRIGPLSEDDSVALFRQRASEHSLDYSSSDHLQKIKEVAEKAGYVPLAIEWIVSQIVIKGVSLENAISRLGSSNEEVLKFCFDNLVAAVGPHAKMLLLAIPVFSQAASMEALSAITDTSRESREESTRRLLKASLIEIEPDGRFSVLALTRLYVNTQWQNYPDLYREYCTRATEYYIGLLQSINRQEKWESIKNEHHNMLALLSWCFENNEFELCVELARFMSEYLQRLSLWDQRLFICELATAAAANIGDRDATIMFMYDAAEIHKARGRLDQALAEFQRCEEYSRVRSDKQMTARARMQIGIVYYHKGRYSESAKHILQSLQINRAISDDEGVAMCLSHLGRNELRSGRPLESLKYFQESLDIKKKTKNQLNIAIGIYDLGCLHSALRDYRKAEEAFKDAIHIIESIGDKRHLANAKWHYALMCIDIGRLETARALLLEVLTIEELLHRDIRIQRANSKLDELELIISGNISANENSLANLEGFDMLFVMGSEQFANLPTIQMARNDINSITKALLQEVSSSTKIINLYGEEAAKDNVVRQLQAVAELCRADQKVLMIFVTHTIRCSGRTYICCYDTSPTELESSAIEGNEFAALLRAVVAKKVILADLQHETELGNISGFDALEMLCELGVSEKYMEYIARSTNSHIIVSATEDQVSHRIPYMYNSLFFNYLIKGMQGSASLRGDGLVYVLDLFYYLEARLEETFDDQHPHLYPQPADEHLVIFRATNRSSQVQSQALEGIDVMEDDQDEIIKISDIRELIVSNPIEGAASLSLYLSTLNLELQNQVDLFRSEMLRIKQDKDKYIDIDSSLITQWQRNISRLLEICQRLQEDARQ